MAILLLSAKFLIQFAIMAFLMMTEVKDVCPSLFDLVEEKSVFHGGC